MGTRVLCGSWVEDAEEWGVTKFCWCSLGSLCRLLVFSLNLQSHSFPWAVLRVSRLAVSAAVCWAWCSVLCSCSRCQRPVPALATCWTLRQKEMATRLGLESQHSTWARQWKHSSRRSSLSRGRCICTGKESIELGIEERENYFLCKVPGWLVHTWMQSSLQFKGLLLWYADHLLECM